MSQKLQLKSDLTLETAIQIARQSEMVKSQATDQNSRASKDVDEVPSKKTPVSSRWRKKKGKKKDSSQKQTQRKVADAVSITQSQNSVLRKIRNL